MEGQRDEFQGIKTSIPVNETPQGRVYSYRLLLTIWSYPVICNFFASRLELRSIQSRALNIPTDVCFRW